MRASIAALIVASAAFPSNSHGQDVSSIMDVRSGGIVVYGVGEARARPNQIEIDMHAKGDAELTEDALVKFTDAKKRAIEAFEALKLEKLSVKELGLSVTPGNAQEMYQAMWNGRAVNTTTKTPIEISSTLRLELRDVSEQSREDLLKTVGKLLDVARDSGVNIGPSAAEVQMAYRYGRQPSEGVVRFVVEDLKQIREEAYERAVSDARRRAERLARLNGLALGYALSVNEVQVSGDEEMTRNVQPWEVGRKGKSEDEQLESDVLDEIPFRVKLLVRFAVEPAKTASADKSGLKSGDP